MEKKWIVLNPQMEAGEEDRWSEVAEGIPTVEFTSRLARTLQFLSENERTNCADVINEHSKFLLSLQR